MLVKNAAVENPASCRCSVIVRMSLRRTSPFDRTPCAWGYREVSTEVSEGQVSLRGAIALRQSTPSEATRSIEGVVRRE
jgi:hypothetical protein